MKYLVYNFELSDSSKQEQLSALLLHYGFDGVEIENNAILAYIDKASFSDLDDQVVLYLENHAIPFSHKTISDENWNALWEASFEPISIEDELFIGADHHTADKNYRYQLLINPKMTFGTGHHPTTYLMCKLLLKEDLRNKSVLDFGTGSGILGILASKMGAEKVFANDTDPNCTQNVAQNCRINQVKNLEYVEGDAKAVPNEKYDVVLANVTRNVILDNKKTLYSRLAPNGVLLLSGFYEEDAEKVISGFAPMGIKTNSTYTHNKWSVLKLKF